MNIAVTAVLCTRNRANYLRKALTSLVEQSLPDSSYEILVVDNGSTDETKAVILEEFADVSNLRYVYEPVLGLSNARNTGWKNAAGDYVAYLDDDALASPFWLETILMSFETVEPQPSCVGGPIELLWESPRPFWLSDNLLGFLGQLSLSDTPAYLAEQNLFGGNLAISKKVLESADGFNVALGRSDGNLLSNEEILFQKRIKAVGGLCYYHPKALVQHHVPADRLRKGWFIKRAYWQGLSAAVTERQLHTLSMSENLKKFISIMLCFFRPPWRLAYLFFPSGKPDYFVRKCKIFQDIGLGAGRLKS